MARDRDARIIAMAASGIVTGKIETGFNGQLRTLSIRAAIEIRRNRSKSADLQPDYRIYSDGAEIGAGWIRYSELSEQTYVSLNFAAPEFGPRRLYANPRRAPGQDDDNCYAIPLGNASCRERVCQYV